MAREFRTLAEISEWLTAQVRHHPECAEAAITVQYQLQEPDEDGCNWSRDLVINAGTGDFEDMRARLALLFEEARRRFNVPS